MLIPIARLRPDSTPVRHQHQAGDDAALQASMATLGQLDPVLVVRLGDDLDEDPDYEVKDGNRRLAAAKAMGWETVACWLLPRSRADFTLAAATAANVVRVPLQPVDQWRAVLALQERGYDLPGAAAALGLSERRVAQLDRLGRLHPDMLALVEAGHRMPTETELRAIAAVPHDLQRQAAATKHAVQRSGSATVVQWDMIAEACRRHRITRAAAIFNVDTAGVAFERDFFAPPGSDEEWTTTDVATFLAAQRQALDAQAAASGGKLVAVDESKRELGSPALPKGWNASYGQPDKPTKRERIFACVASRTGTVVRVTAVDAKAEDERKRRATEKAAARAKADAAPPAPEAAATPPGPAPAAPAAAPAAPAATPAAAEDPDEDPDADPDEELPAPAPSDAKPGLTKSSQQVLADLKTAGLRARLRDRTAPIDTDTLLALLVLALHAQNVTVANYEHPPGNEARAGADLVRRLVTPEGHLQYDAAELPTLAREALARVLSFDHPEIGYNPYKRRSGATAEWTAATIGVEPGRHRPRLDTAELLAGCDASTLKAAAAVARLKFTTAAAAKRELVGKVDGWAPAFAHFGAPGPRPAKGGI
jgi:ParB/RepB/Spo0J family partition protein